MTAHPAGLVAVPCRPDQARHVPFFQSLLNLRMPSGSEVKLFPGFHAHENRNRAVDYAVRSGLKWVFFVDDDQLLEPDALERLLDHGVDIVSCNLIAKSYPFPPYMFQEFRDAGLLPMHLDDRARGLIEVSACGLGGVLVNISVFRKLPRPWFDVTYRFKTDDLYFCDKAREHGFIINYDCDVPSGHILQASVWPEWDNEKGYWKTAVVFSNGERFYVPAAGPSLEYQTWVQQQDKKARG